MPMPVSATLKRTAPSTLPATVMVTVPDSVIFMALPTRVTSIWRSRSGSPLSQGASPRIGPLTHL